MGEKGILEDAKFVKAVLACYALNQICELPS